MHVTKQYFQCITYVFIFFGMMSSTCISTARKCMDSYGWKEMSNTAIQRMMNIKKVYPFKHVTFHKITGIICQDS